MQEEGDSRVVLVTGGGGFLGLHCVAALLGAGFRVRASLRHPADAAKAAPLRRLAAGDPSRLELVKADLLDPESWVPAVAGVEFVVHVASPFPASVVSEAALVRPAVEGTLAVLRGAAAADVRRVVLTSSVAAISYGHVGSGQTLFSERDWTRLDSPDVGAYPKSKTLAESAAWDFVRQLPGCTAHSKAPEVTHDQGPASSRLELVSVNPGFLLGPLLGSGGCSSADVVGRFLWPDLPAIPRLKMEYADVRDAARAHVLALLEPRAAGERIIVSSGTVWFRDITMLLRDEFGPFGYRPVTWEAPAWLLKLVSIVDPMVALICPRLGYDFDVNDTKAAELLGLKTRPLRESLRDMGHSLVAHGIVPQTKAYKSP